jgi:hypothetical protein
MGSDIPMGIFIPKAFDICKPQAMFGVHDSGCPHREYHCLWAAPNSFVWGDDYLNIFEESMIQFEDF